MNALHLTIPLDWLWFWLWIASRYLVHRLPGGLGSAEQTTEQRSAAQTNTDGGSAKPGRGLRHGGGVEIANRCERAGWLARAPPLARQPRRTHPAAGARSSAAYGWLGGLRSRAVAQTNEKGEWE